LVPNARPAHIYHVRGLDIGFAVSSLVAIFLATDFIGIPVA
jgi:hypothetical protein